MHPVVDTFKLIAETKRQAGKISESARNAIKAFYRNPADLAAFIERHQTPVYILPKGFLTSFSIWLLGYEPGFIPPSNGRRYQLLQKLLASFNLKGKQGEKHACHFEHGVFVITRPLFTVGFLSHQLHHWLAYRSGMKGYDERSLKLYRKFWNEHGGVIGNEVYDMSLEDMVSLKAAINRDLEAMVFLRGIVNEILIPSKNARHHFKKGHTLA